MDYFIDPDASKIGEKNFQKKMEIGKNFINEGIYKSREEISEEYQRLKPLSPVMVSNPRFFHIGKTFFLQVQPDTATFPELKDEKAEMHPHYYWLKKTMHQKRLHVFPYLIRAKDFKEHPEVLKETFGIESYAELNDLHYVVVNVDKMKLPVGGRFSKETSVPSSIAIKFVTNPIRINTEDELFELLDANRNQPIKYFLMLNPNN